MRSDVAGLRTWLLAGFGGWALLVWGATLFGLGSRIGSADGALALPTLPALPVTGAPRAQASDNTQALQRPLFSSDRRPHPFVMGDASGEPSTGSVRLTGVLMAPGLEMATLTTEQGKSLRLRLGDEPQAGWQLLSLQPRSAVVSGPSGTLNLELQVFSGGGAQPAVQVPPASGSPAPAPSVPPVSGQAVPAQPVAGPSAEQIQAIRDRIQARRRQAQQQRNGSTPAGQNP